MEALDEMMSVNKQEEDSLLPAGDFMTPHPRTPSPSHLGKVEVDDSTACVWEEGVSPAAGAWAAGVELGHAGTSPCSLTKWKEQGMRRQAQQKQWSFHLKHIIALAQASVSSSFK